MQSREEAFLHGTLWPGGGFPPGTAVQDRVDAPERRGQRQTVQASVWVRDHAWVLYMAAQHLGDATPLPRARVDCRIPTVDTGHSVDHSPCRVGRPGSAGSRGSPQSWGQSYSRGCL